MQMQVVRFTLIYPPASHSFILLDRLIEKCPGPVLPQTTRAVAPKIELKFNRTDLLESTATNSCVHPFTRQARSNLLQTHNYHMNYAPKMPQFRINAVDKQNRQGIPTSLLPLVDAHSPRLRVIRALAKNHSFGSIPI